MKTYPLTKRNPLLDVLKGVAITLVIWGHVMQLMGVVPHPMDNYLWKAIYMFHMPLFFFISGYLSVGAVHRNFKDVFCQRARTLLLPLCLWSAVLCLEKLLLGVNCIDTSSTFSIIKSIGSGFVYGYWFIWVLLYCLLLTNLLFKISKSTYILIFTVFAIWLLPDINFPYIHYTKTMYPFFVSGYIYATHKERLNFVKSRYFMLAAIAAFLICLRLYNINCMMFIPSWCLDFWHEHISRLRISQYYIFFLTAGFSGILICYNMVKLLPPASRLYHLFQDTGRYTLIIYMLQGLWFFAVCKAYLFHVTYQTAAFALGIAVTYAIYRIGKWMANNKRCAWMAGK